MYLTKRHVAENALIPRILEKLEAAGQADAIRELPVAYGNKLDYLTPLATATALSLVETAAKKGVDDPMKLFDPGKVIDFILQATANAAAKNVRSYLPLLTSYPAKTKINYNDQFNYKGQRYDNHPIEKKIDSNKAIREITKEEHLAHVLHQLEAHDIPYHRAELEKAFAEKHSTYTVDATIDDSDSRLPVSYYSSHGNIDHDGFKRHWTQEKRSPRLFALIRKRIIEHIKNEVANADGISFDAPMRINLELYRNPPPSIVQNRMSVTVNLAIHHLDHHLRPAIEDLHCMADVLLNEDDIENFEGDKGTSRVNKRIDIAIEKTLLTLGNTIKARAVKARRRRKAAKRLGDDTLSIDKVAQTLILLVAKNDPKQAREIILGTKNHFNFRSDNGYVFLGDNKSHEGRAGFQTKDGKLSCSFKMSANQRWLHSGLMIDMLPIVVAESLIDRPAHDVVDHEIANLLGPVKNVKSRGRWSTIMFEPMFESIDRKQLLAQIPEEQE